MSPRRRGTRASRSWRRRSRLCSRPSAWARLPPRAPPWRRGATQGWVGHTSPAAASSRRQADRARVIHRARAHAGLAAVARRATRPAWLACRRLAAAWRAYWREAYPRAASNGVGAPPARAPGRATPLYRRTVQRRAVYTAQTSWLCGGSSRRARRRSKPRVGSSAAARRTPPPPPRARAAARRWQCAASSRHTHRPCARAATWPTAPKLARIASVTPCESALEAQSPHRRIR